MEFLVLLSIFLFLNFMASPTLVFAKTLDILLVHNRLVDGQTLVSPNQRFELGFYSPKNSTYRYLGVWYVGLPLTVVWTANGASPLTDHSGEVRLQYDGSLCLYNSTTLVWKANPNRQTKRLPSVKLLETGNLVLIEDTKTTSFLWQSFDHPCNVLLPGMKLGWNIKTGFQRNLTAGEFSFSLDSPESSQLVLLKGNEKENRWGPWDGFKLSGLNEIKPYPFFKPIFISNPTEVYYTYDLENPSTQLILVVTEHGSIQFVIWRNHSNEWVKMVTLQRDICDRCNMCGPNGICYYRDEPNCKCLVGFEPKSPQDWNQMDWSGGCVRKFELGCDNGDQFMKYKGLKFPDNLIPVPEFKRLEYDKCELVCWKNCSCTAYVKINGGGDCLMWFGDLIDVRNFQNGGDEIYLRMAKKEIENLEHAAAERKRAAKIVTIIVVSTVLVIILLCIFFCHLICKIRRGQRAVTVSISSNDPEEENEGEEVELPIFDFVTISAATNRFSVQNKIGQGGFGTVYKGVLPNGQEIAVKRLSRSSGQGVQEFKNEVLLITNLQHRNLVKLLGCCMQGELKMLVYEYLPNKSLDYFLFDQDRRKFLAWNIRFNIVVGVARGLLYLHQDSRVRIIHRDLKASNILLDNDMNPKISDFGIARIFGGGQTEELTKTIIGTCGYMSPEYALNGHFSVKSDVFSFGVLMLEILSGKKNWGFHHPDHDCNLIGHAWKLWKDENPLELMDEEMEGLFSIEEVLKCVQVALLCVEQRAEDRPMMSSVLCMLSNESPVVRQPKEPGFCAASSSMRIASSSGQNPHTDNEVTVTDLSGR